MQVHIAAVSDIGTTRSTNQDSACTICMDTPQGEMVLAVVCDGMGGYEDGELASATVVEGFREWVRERLAYLCDHPLRETQIRDEWSRLIAELNQRVYYHGQANGIRLGTTVTALLATREMYYVVNVGDSRTYCVCNYGLSQVTTDHSFVYEEYQAGRMTKEEMELDERRNILTRAMGAKDEVEPDFFSGRVLPGMTFVLCSDGAHHTLAYGDLLALAEEGQQSECHLEQKLTEIVYRIKSGPEDDNITMSAVVLR